MVTQVSEKVVRQRSPARSNMALSIFTSNLLPFVFILSAASAAAPDAAGEVEFLDARLDPEASNAVGEGRSFFTSNGQGRYSIENKLA